MEYKTDYLDNIIEQYNITQEQMQEIIEKIYTNMLREAYKNTNIFAKFINNSIQAYMYDSETSNEYKSISMPESNHAIYAKLRKELIQELHILQKLNEYNYFKDKVGQLFEATITNILSDNTLVVKVNNKYYGEIAFIKKPNLALISINMKIFCILDKVYNNAENTYSEKRHGYQLIFENSSNLFIQQLLFEYMPQIKLGMIEIVDIVRIYGKRCKVVVSSKDSKLNPVSICIGRGGANAKKLKDEFLFGEAIDFVMDAQDLEGKIIACCAPCKVANIIVMSDNSIKIVIYDQLERDEKQFMYLTNSINIALITKLLFPNNSQLVQLIFRKESEYKIEIMEAQRQLYNLLIDNGIDENAAKNLSLKCSELNDLLFISEYNIDEETKNQLNNLLHIRKKQMIGEFVYKGGEAEFLEYMMYRFSRSNFIRLQMVNILSFNDVLQFTNSLELSKITGLDISFTTTLLKEVNNIINDR